MPKRSFHLLFMFLLLGGMSCAPIRQPTEAVGSNNAAYYYLDAFDSISGMDDPKLQPEIQSVIKGGWKGGNKRLQGLLKDNAPSLKKVKEAAPVEKCDFNLGKKERYQVQRKSPPFQKMQALVRLLLLEAKSKEGQGQFSEALEDYHHALLFSRHVAQDPSLILKLTALDFEREVYTALNNFIEVSPAHRQALSKILKNHRGRHFLPEEMVLAEEEFYRSTVRMLVDEGRRQAMQDPRFEKLTKEQKDQWELFLREMSEHSLELSERYYGNFIKAAKTGQEKDWVQASEEFDTLKMQLTERIDPEKLSLWREWLTNKREKTAQSVPEIMIVSSVPGFKKAFDDYRETVEMLSQLESPTHRAVVREIDGM